MNQLIKNWVVQMGGDETFPFIVIDNWYDPDTEKSVWKELDFLSCVDRANQQRAENTVVARTKDGESLSRSYRWYPFQIYNTGIVYTSGLTNNTGITSGTVSWTVRHDTPESGLFYICNSHSAMSGDIVVVK